MKNFRELIESVGAKVFLSPYSPDFNPIENRYEHVEENKNDSKNYLDALVARI